jgi:hypothetical protein
MEAIAVNELVTHYRVQVPCLPSDSLCPSFSYTRISLAPGSKVDVCRSGSILAASFVGSYKALV